MGRRRYVTVVVLSFGFVTFHGSAQKAKTHHAEPADPSPCSGGGQITIPIPPAPPTVGTLRVVYMGTDSALYRITPVSESSNQGITITASIALNSDHVNLITFDAFRNGSGLSSVDVEGQKIEIQLNNVATTYGDSTATFCYFRLK
jgi:hypothetical protein